VTGSPRHALTGAALALLPAILAGAPPVSAPILSPIDVQRTTAGSSPWAGSRVALGGVVTGVSPDGLFYYVADPSGGEWSGLKVEGRALRRRIGERVSVMGEVQELFGETRLRERTSRAMGSGELPAPAAVPLAELNAERWEGVLVRVDDVVVLGPTSGAGEFPIQDSSGGIALVDDEFHTWYIADVGDRFESITGIVAFGFGDFQLEPRSDADLAGWTSGRAFDAEIRFRVTDATGAPIPCKVTLFPVGGSPLALGPDDRAEGSEDVAYLVLGEGTVRLPAGTYDLVISRGIEYGLHEERITVASGGSPLVSATLAREVDTRGWISADFHLHSAPSSDSPVPVAGRIRTLAGEGVEWGIATDHNRVTDYAPVIAELGLSSWITSSIGQEITTQIFGHFNAWPLEAGRQPVPWQNVTPAGLFGFAHADPGVDVVQVNHPVIASWGDQYFQIYAVSPFTGEPENAGFSFDFDVLEVMNGRHFDQGLDNFETWMRMLNNGRRITASGNSDSHHVVFTEPGYPRNFVAAQGEPDEAREEDLVQAVLDGRVFVSYGPILDFTANGFGLGELADAPGGDVALELRVQCASWLRASQATIYANAEPVGTMDFGSGSESPQDAVQAFVHRPARDTWYVVLVEGPGGLAPVRRGAEFRPLAFTNPIWVDADGDGAFDPPGNFANALPIAEAREVDSQGAGVRIGEWVAIEGCATTDTRFGESTGLFYVQDATGGLQVRETLGPITEIRRGDPVRAAGIVSQVLGEMVLVDAKLEVPAPPGSCPDPLDIVTGAVGWGLEAREGSVVRITGANVVSGSWPQNGVEGLVTIDDGSGAAALFVPPGVVVPPEAADLSDFRFTALLGQRDFSPPYQSGYRLTLRSASDVEGLAGGALAASTGVEAFGRPRPNPFRTELTIPVFPRPGEPLPGIVVHNVAGQVVRRLTAESSQARAIVWDGRDARGRTAGPGVYFVRLLGAGEDQTIRVVKAGS
jgi:hypothetical protein